MKSNEIIDQCRKLIAAYHCGDLGDCPMPEESSPNFTAAESEARIAYFTLPMALNYQRDSYKLWQSALLTYDDLETRDVFNVDSVANMNVTDLQKKLMKYKVALQPNKHVQTWLKIAQTIAENWESFTNLLQACDGDFLQLREAVQGTFKKGFPYISGPKIFNYWSFILSTYGQVELKNKQYIDIAPDTHVIQCSVRLGVISQFEAEMMSREKIAEKWRALLVGTEINPVDLHSPLWFWSRSGFAYQLRA